MMMDERGLTPFDRDTVQRLDAVEHKVDRLIAFLDKAEPWLDEWVGRGANDGGLRDQVVAALRERQAAKIGATLLKWLVAVLASLAAIWAAMHEFRPK